MLPRKSVIKILENTCDGVKTEIKILYRRVCSMNFSFFEVIFNEKRARTKTRFTSKWKHLSLYNVIYRILFPLYRLDFQNGMKT